ncbi:MAG: hypothetical protein KGM98_07975, partial [Bacteroidota bacterium]|nr:hypothetical protein [Bacteroidota bacterium]
MEETKKNSEYSHYIRDLAVQNKDVVFFNSSREHASIVMGTMYEFAEKEVKIYCSHFSGEISGQAEYQRGLEKYLSKGQKLKILMQRDKYESRATPPEIFRLLRLYYIINPESIEIKTHPYIVHKEGSDAREIHFMVADDRMYRLEEDISRFTAVCNFNDRT